MDPVRGGPGGFTIVEILVACVIVATALLGVYGVFARAMAVEGQARESWSDRQAATAAVTEPADALQGIVNLQGADSLIVQPTAGGLIVTCLALGDGARLPSRSAAIAEVVGSSEKRRFALQWRRYEWVSPTGEQRSGRLEVRRSFLSGSVRIDPAELVPELPPEKLWQHVEPQLIADRLDGFSVECLPLDDPGGGWRPRWSGRSGRVAVRITATCGEHTAERIVLPAATGWGLSGAGQ
ncbi:MAG TPA: prepilin-type N-terminal cleavage/methylation domain-containing protein [Phycisphaerae bacterium]|nr:prepilin-type N-terminal cleavage/methylation domain-containing protein [Phycisphaerae bacterium]HUU23061.1 prepilin-type N-terminal cleavage/methylation domain-containing protein [Phycisphaerae bacterium]